MCPMWSKTIAFKFQWPLLPVKLRRKESERRSLWGKLSASDLDITPEPIDRWLQLGAARSGAQLVSRHFRGHLAGAGERSLPPWVCCHGNFQILQLWPPDQARSKDTQQSELKHRLNATPQTVRGIRSCWQEGAVPSINIRIPR